MSDTKKKEKLHIEPEEIALLDDDPDHLSVVETFIYEPNEEESSLGWLFIVGQVYTTQKKKENARILIEIAEKIKNEYYRNAKRSPLSSLKASLKKINEKIKKLNRQHSSFKATVSVGAIVENTLFTSRLGEGVLFVTRDKKRTPLGDAAIYSKEKQKNNSFSSVVKGELRQDDIVVFATPQIYKSGTKHLARRLEQQKFFPFILKKKEEFKNLGCIVVYCNKAPEKQQEGERKVYINKKRILSYLPFIKKIKRPVIIGVIIAMVIAITFSAVVLKTRTTQNEHQAQELLEQTQEFEAQISSLLELENKNEAQEILSRWKGALTTLKRIGVMEEKVNERERAYNQSRVRVYDFEEVTGQEIASFSNSSTPFSPTGIFIEEAMLFLFGESKFYTLSLENNQGSFTELPKNKDGIRVDIKSMVATEDTTRQNTFILSEDALFEKTPQDLTLVLQNKELRTVNHIAVFNNALYLFSPRVIWTLSLTEENSQLQEWLSGNNVSAIQDGAVDGFVWALEENGTLKKFLKGSEVASYDVGTQNKQIYTTHNLSSLYLLNPQEGIVSVYDEFGNIERRIAHPALREAQDFTVSAEEEVIYALNNKSVFELELE